MNVRIIGEWSEMGREQKHVRCSLLIFEMIDPENE